MFAEERQDSFPGSSGGESRSRKTRILLAEDNKINRFVALKMLERLGYDAEAVSNGREVIKALEKSPYDLILMDISMPVLDGVEATRNIRKAESAGRRVPIIALTAHALPVDRERFLEAGMDDILIKPISRSSMRAVLEEIVNRKVRVDNLSGV